MNNKYNEIIDKLRKINPAPTSDQKLTDSIIYNIESLSGKENHYIKLDVSDKQWSVINVFRVLLTSAAVFLIGYLVYQQWETNQKLETLKEVVLLNPNIPNYEQHSNKELEKVFNELKITNASLIEKKPQIEKLLIERKSLNYLMYQIKELKKENESFREKLRKMYESKNLKK
jgi:hypothetical protein